MVIARNPGSAIVNQVGAVCCVMKVSKTDTYVASTIVTIKKKVDRFIDLFYPIRVRNDGKLTKSLCIKEKSKFTKNLGFDFASF